MGIVGKIVDSIKAKSQEYQKAADDFDTEFRPELAVSEKDEREPAQNNFRNFFIDKVGAPESWKISAADEKRYIKNAPEMIAGSTTGSLKSAKSIASKIKPQVEKPAEAALSKVNSLLNPTAEEIVAKNVRVADSTDFALGSQMAKEGAPVFDKGPKAYGAVKSPEPKFTPEEMAEVQTIVSGMTGRPNMRTLFKENPSAYQLSKQETVDTAKKFVLSKRPK